MRHHRPQTAEQLRTDLFEAARRWSQDDPDPMTRAQLEDIVERARAEVGETDDGGQALAELQDSFADLLEFGTAGLRGRMGPGPNRMNRAVVIRAAAGLTAYLQTLTAEPTVVVGYDARHGSRDFALDTASVVTAAGGRAVLLPQPWPTPVLAFAIRRLGADAGVMVTASHNPPQDNGYKVYLQDGAQIVPPADADIRAQIMRIEWTADVRRVETGWTVLDASIAEDYSGAVTGILSADGPRDVTLVHTALHGVGGDLLQRAFAMAGFPAPVSVAEQAEPDPDFPTVTFPNPEEPGAIDAALDLARRLDAEGRPVHAVIANDPDADRCAVAVPDPASAREDDPRGWRMLRGDELGALLAVHLVERGIPEGKVLARSIVSSRLLGAIAAAAGLGSAETLTGFKWIARAPDLAYGYEEALGYCVAPDLVRDKDGISAALVFAEFAAGLVQRGGTATGVLDELYRRHGVYATDAFSVRVDDLNLIDAVMTRLREQAPERVGESAVRSWDDLSVGGPDLPPTDGLRYYLEDDTRVIVRPSGTEPKLKVYLEAIVPVGGESESGESVGGESVGGESVGADSESGGSGDGRDAQEPLRQAKAEAARRLAAARATFEELTRP